MTQSIFISCKPDEEIKMALYSGIDLHGNNNVTLLLDDYDRMIYQKRLPNHLPTILEQLAPFQADIKGVVVESTFNWYWLVDGLMEADYQVHLANSTAIQQYSGLKYTDDHSDARWLAHLLRFGVLPEGYIYPKEQRPLGDLLRKRGHLVEQQTSNVLSIQNIISRNTGIRLRVDQIKQLKREGYPVNESDLAHVWPTRYEHVNVYGRYHFNIEEARERKGLRPLR
jgi:hypothetical protein